jgi:prophage antirepressor-like protein
MDRESKDRLNQMEVVMGNVIKFEAHGKEYPLSIHDVNGNKWIFAQQVGEALGVHRLARLIYELRDLGEIKEKKHYCTVTGLNSGAGRPDKLMLSYRGIIRVAMRSQGTRAREFRDWAEEVLYQVMMTGSYEIDRSFPEAVSLAESAGMKKAFIIREISERNNIDMETLGMIIKFRKMGMTQTQAGAAYGLSKWKVKQLEADLKEAGISIPAVRKKSMQQGIDDLVNVLTSVIDAPLTGGHEARPYGVNGGHVARPYGVTGDRAKDLSPLRIGGGAAL